MWQQACEGNPALCTTATMPKRQLLDGLLVRCPKGCKQVVELKHPTACLTSKCTHTVVPSPSNYPRLPTSPSSSSSTRTRIMTSQTIGQLLDRVLPLKWVHLNSHRKDKYKITVLTAEHRYAPIPVESVHPEFESGVASNQTQKRRSSEMKVMERSAFMAKISLLCCCLFGLSAFPRMVNSYVLEQTPCTEEV